MDNMREKLVELIKKVPYGVSVGATFEQYFCEKIADHLIANGVTVQEWIPVTERLPDKELNEQKASTNGHKVFHCLIVVEFNGFRGVRTAWYERSINGETYRFLDENSIDVTKRTLYWMPLPTPPKGE